MAGLLRTGWLSLCANRRLRISFGLWALAGLLLCSGVSAGLVLANSAAYIWLVAVAAAWWLLLSVLLVAGLTLLYTPAGNTIDYLGIPNGLSALRAWAVFPLFLSAALPLGEPGFYFWSLFGGCVGMLDFVDGYVARRHGPITALGKALDPAMDTLLFSSAAVGAYLLHLFPFWLMILVAFRYLGPFCITPVVFLLGKRPELVHTAWGRRNTALTGGVFFVLMWIRLFHGPVEMVAPALALPLLLPSMVLHFWALWQRTAAAPVASRAGAG